MFPGLTAWRHHVEVAGEYKGRRCASLQGGDHVCAALFHILDIRLQSTVFEFAGEELGNLSLGAGRVDRAEADKVSGELDNKIAFHRRLSVHVSFFPVPRRMEYHATP